MISFVFRGTGDVFTVTFGKAKFRILKLSGSKKPSLSSLKTPNETNLGPGLRRGRLYLLPYLNHLYCSFGHTGNTTQDLYIIGLYFHLFSPFVLHLFTICQLSFFSPLSHPKSWILYSSSYIFRNIFKGPVRSDSNTIEVVSLEGLDKLFATLCLILINMASFKGSEG
jgi:hypothetical protein